MKVLDSSRKYRETSHQVFSNFIKEFDFLKEFYAINPKNHRWDFNSKNP